ncbi:FAD-dependent oxidoreductase [Mucilaginibacter myungsuensis]|uniref:FAD-dependent oxidoreductase n=1 Tax=Mucilaginibacter myungsuensis TaxID=649104 RepID=A0A929KYK8_9SPHI|nr:FAD-dependent oxidoreductase [Mucilaginibacter myungsuensis]MBE9664061.1 FAD-dependent oxidoreductase [Mucilaginibacter myungsuensis]MDN3601239.1 FAD-dependent oxidoreductase [Mucilaginibacter myungsuensis]
MVKKLLLIVLFLTPITLFAETIRTDVLVVGGTASGVAAAIQSARSQVKTLLIEPTPWLGGEMTAGGMSILDANPKLSSGIWAEFRKRVRDFYKRTPGYDTTSTAPLKFEPYTGAAVLKRICDTVNHLTLKLNTPYLTAKRDSGKWVLTVLIDGKEATIKAKVLVDATPNGDIAALAGAKLVSGFDSKQDTGESLAPETASPIIQDVTWIAVVKEFEKNAIYLMPKPAEYDPARYVALKTKNIKKMLEEGRLPNNKFQIKWTENTYGTSVAQMSIEGRIAYYKTLRLHTLGLVYYLQNELGFRNIGIDDSEFPSSDHLPFIPYIREYRRSIGQTRMTTREIYTPYVNNLYRTSIAVGDAPFTQQYADPLAPKINYPPMPAYTVPLGAVVDKDIPNLVVTEKAMSVTHLVNASTSYPSVQMAIGQGAGTVAAYCAFFDLNTKQLDVRKIQIEATLYGSMIYPYADIPQTDRYYRAVQQVTGTGLLKQVQELNGNKMDVVFKPDSTVNTADIKPIMLETYTRAFIWFGKNKPAETFAVGDLVSYISDHTLTDPKTLKNMMQRQWHDYYKFKQPFDMQRPVTRYEFAVLVNRYLNPFARSVDVTGKIVN